MKVLVYSAKKDELPYFYEYEKKYDNIELTIITKNLTIETVHLAKGYEAVCISSILKIDGNILKKLNKLGIKYIQCRSVGINHIDLNTLASLPIKLLNIPNYSPNAISEHTIMLALMMVRKERASIYRNDEHDYRLDGMLAKELKSMTIGVIGTGRIGKEVCKAFSGLGSHILCYDIYPSDEISQIATYTSLEEIYKKCDLITYHCPLTKENYHMVNTETISKMKEHVLLINVARGDLFDYNEIYRQLISGKIGALAFDVYDKESAVIRKKIKTTDISDELFLKLTSLDNVIYTPHTAFYTDTAISNIVHITMENLNDLALTKSCKNEINIA